MRFWGLFRRNETARANAADDVPDHARPAVLAFGDGWSRAALASTPTEPQQLRWLREALAEDYGARPQQSSAWQTAAQPLDSWYAPEVRTAFWAMFEALVDAAPYAAATASVDARPLLVSRANTVCSVNAVWAAAELRGAEEASRIGSILSRVLTEPWTVDSVRLRNACANALAVIGTQQAVDLLATAAQLAPTKAQKEYLLLCMGTAAREVEPLPSRLAELNVPDHGLDANGRKEFSVRRYRFELRLHPGGRVIVIDRKRGATPDKAAEWMAAAEARAVRTTYRRELARIVTLLASTRSWPGEEWKRLYLDHPITRVVSCGLVWRMDFPDGRVLDCVPNLDGGVLTSDGRRTPPHLPLFSRIGAVPQVSLWHPGECDEVGFRAWRDLVAAGSLSQPFEQILRDFTAVEPDPEATELRRFSGTVLGSKQFAAAIRSVGWHSRRTRSVRPADTIRLAHRAFPDDGLSVVVACQEAEDTVVLGTAWFHRTKDDDNSPLPMEAVPPRVYSEALRDLTVLTRKSWMPQDEISDTVG